MPIGLWVCGAQRILTVDLNPYLKIELVRKDVSVRWTHLALRVGEKLRTVDTQHGSNSLTVLVQICEVNTICQQVSDYLLQQGYEMCKVLIRVSGNDCRCVSKGH